MYIVVFWKLRRIEIGAVYVITKFTTKFHTHQRRFCRFECEKYLSSLALSVVPRQRVGRSYPAIAKIATDLENLRIDIYGFRPILRDTQ